MLRGVKIKVVLALSLTVINTLSNSVLAASNNTTTANDVIMNNSNTEMPSKTNVDLKHTWTIRLNQSIAKDTSTKGIYIQDSKGNKIGVTAVVGNDSKSIVVTPTTSYKAGENYTLYVTGVTSNNKKLKTNIKMSFATTTSTATTPSTPSSNAGYSTVGVKYTKDVNTVISELSSATETLRSSINSGTWDVEAYSDLCFKLYSVEAKLTLDSTSRTNQSLINAINVSKSLVGGTQVPTSNPNSKTLTSRQSLAKEILGRIQKVEGLKVGNTVGGIQVRYGNHTYGCKSQQEYEAVMVKVDEALIKSANDVTTLKYLDYLIKYENGDKAYKNKEDKWIINQLDSYNMFLTRTDNQYHSIIMIARNAIGVLLEAGGHTIEPDAYKKVTAYDQLFRGVAKCDGDAYISEAVFDSLGYNTKIIGDSSHAECLIQVGSYWWSAQDLRMMSDTAGWDYDGVTY